MTVRRPAATTCSSKVERTPSPTPAAEPWRSPTYVWPASRCTRTRTPISTTSAATIFRTSSATSTSRCCTRSSSRAALCVPSPDDDQIQSGEFYRHTFNYYQTVKNQTGRIAFDAPVAWSGGLPGKGLTDGESDSVNGSAAGGGSVAACDAVPRRPGRLVVAFGSAAPAPDHREPQQEPGHGEPRARRRQRRRPAGLRQPGRASG